MGVSTMSDYDRNIAAAPFGRTMGQVGSVAVDEGLRTGAWTASFARYRRRRAAAFRWWR